MVPAKSLRRPCAGQTGTETVELVRGAAENARPDLIVAIDALAARAVSRLATTIQLSDKGINPGSGIGNRRRAICQENVGRPVLALGVPTVVDSSTLVYDALSRAGIREISDDLHRAEEAESLYAQGERYIMKGSRAFSPAVVLCSRQTDSISKPVPAYNQAA